MFCEGASETKNVHRVSRLKMNDIKAFELKQEGRPFYFQVKDAIESRLASGVWKPGEQLPTETELSKEFGVSEGTIRQAVIALVKEGRLTRRSGKGTFVARARFDRSFMRFFRFRGGDETRNHEYGLAVIDIKTSGADDLGITKTLDLRKGAKVLSIHRTITQDDTIVCYYVSHLSLSDFPGLSVKDLEDAALYDVLERKHGIHVVRALETLQARAADAEDASILKIRRGEPVIAIERVAYTYGDRAVEVRRTVGRSDKFRYQIQLS